jgi:hypothetical protein
MGQVTHEIPTTLDWAHRKAMNDASKRWAKRDGQPWHDHEDEFLIEYWIDVAAKDRDEVTVSQCLERTIEACRVRCEHIRKRMGWSITVTQVMTTVYIGAHDDDEDKWWETSYYTNQEGK